MSATAVGGDDVWHQDSGGIAGGSEPGDAFGAAVALGDFNGDGFSDLAVGSPGEAIGSIRNAGAINIIYGTASGLSANGAQNDQSFSQNTSGIVDVAEEGDLYGASLAAGDFDGDGYADLAIGVPGEAVGGVKEAGAVAIMYGSSSGLSASGNQVFHQNSNGVAETAETRDHFGAALATGDLNNDGLADLVVGVPGESIGSALETGAIAIFYGKTTHLSGTGSPDDTFLHQNSSGVADAIETGDRFGATVAVGDANGDGFDDIAVGIPGEDVSGHADAGAAAVLYGSSAGATATAAGGDQIWHQNSGSIDGVAEASDQFGASVTFADFNGDGFEDLAVGAPGEAIGSKADAGAVAVIYGNASGLSATSPRADNSWHQDYGNMEGTAEMGDRFGAALSAGDYNNDGRADLAIGVPGQDVGSHDDAGSVAVLYGTDLGLTIAGSPADIVLTQDTANVDGVAETGDRFGIALSSQCTFGGCEKASNSQALSKLATPTVTSGVVKNGTHVLFGWDTVPNRTDFHIHYTYPNGHNVHDATDKTSFAVPMNGQSGQFCMEVRAVEAGRDGDLSNRLCVPAEPPPPADTEAPSQPGWNGYQFDGTSTTFNWKASTDNVGVVSYRAELEGTSFNVTLPASARQHTFDNVPPRDSRYLWRVTAIDAAGNESTPRRTTIKILTPAHSDYVATAVDDVVDAFERWAEDNDNFVAGTRATGWFNHSSTNQAKGLIDAGYLDEKYRTLYYWDLMVRVCGSGESQRIAVLSTANETTTAADRAAWSGCNQRYNTLYGHDYYRVTKPLGELQADTTPPPRVTATSASVTTTTAGLYWNRVNDPSGIDGYLITVNGTLHDEVAASRSSFVFINLDPATRYTMTVQAKDNAGNVGTGTSTTFTTLGLSPLATPEISFATVDRGEVAFGWGSVSGTTEYHWTVIDPSGRQINGSTTGVSDSVPHGLTEGTWCVEVRAVSAGRDSAMSERECTTVVLGSVTGLLRNFTAGPPGTGGVHTPLNGIEVCATPAWEDRETCTTSANDGTFTLRDLAVGQYVVMLVDPLGRYLPKCIADLGRDCSFVQSGKLTIRSTNPDLQWTGQTHMDPVPPPPSNPGVPPTDPEPTDTSPPRWDHDPWANTIVSDLTHGTPRLYFKWENFTDQPLTDPSNVNSVPSSGIKEFELTVDGTTRTVTNGERQISHELIETYLVTLGRPDDRIQTYVEVPGPGTYDVGVRIVDNAGNKSKVATFRLTFSAGSTHGAPGTPSGPEVVVPIIPVDPPPPGVPDPGQGPPRLGPGAWGCPADDFRLDKSNTSLTLRWSIEPGGTDTKYRAFIYNQYDDLLDASVSFVPEISFDGLLRNRLYTVIIQSSTLSDDFLGQCDFDSRTTDNPSFVNVEFPTECRATVTPGFESFNVSWPAAAPAAEIGKYEVRLFDDDGALARIETFEWYETGGEVRIPVWGGFESGASYTLEVRVYDSGQDSALWTQCGDSRVAFRMLKFNTDSAQAWAVCGGASAGAVVVAARDGCVWVNGNGEVAVIDSVQVSLGYQANIEGYVALGYADTSDLNAIGGTSLCGNVSFDVGAGVNVTSCKGHTSGLFGFNGARVHFAGVSAGVGLPASISVGLSRGDVHLLTGGERADALEALCEDVDSMTTSLPRPPVC